MTAQQLDVDKLKTDGKLMVESPLGTMWVYSTDTYLGVTVSYTHLTLPTKRIV